MGLSVCPSVCLSTTCAVWMCGGLSCRTLQEGDEEVREVLHQLKVMAGLSSDDPPDSEWIKLEKTDKKTGKRVRSTPFFCSFHAFMLVIYMIHIRAWNSCI